MPFMLMMMILHKFSLSFVSQGKEFAVVQKEVGEILQGRILVGHAIQHDLQVHEYIHLHPQNSGIIYYSKNLYL